VIQPLVVFCFEIRSVDLGSYRLLLLVDKLQNLTELVAGLCYLLLQFVGAVLRSFEFRQTRVACSEGLVLSRI
jgi:hypothetical protein